MLLNLAERDPAILLSSLYEALRDGADTITLELLGPGIMLHDTALMLFEVLRNRPTHIHIHAIFMESLLVLVGNRSHGHSKLLHLLTASDHASVVVAQDGEWFANQARVENSLATGIEIVAIDHRKTSARPACWITKVTKPR